MKNEKMKTAVWEYKSAAGRFCCSACRQFAVSYGKIEALLPSCYGCGATMLNERYVLYENDQPVFVSAKAEEATAEMIRLIEEGINDDLFEVKISRGSGYYRYLTSRKPETTASVKYEILYYDKNGARFTWDDISQSGQ